MLEARGVQLIPSAPVLAAELVLQPLFRIAGREQEDLVTRLAPVDRGDVVKPRRLLEHP